MCFYCFSWLKIAQGVRTEPGAVEACDGVAKGGKGASDLAVAALVHGDLVLRIAAFYLGYSELASTVFELYANVRYHLVVEWLEWFVEYYFIDLGFTIPGVCELVCEVAVVCE